MGGTHVNIGVSDGRILEHYLHGFNDGFKEYSRELHVGLVNLTLAPHVRTTGEFPQALSPPSEDVRR